MIVDFFLYLSLITPIRPCILRLSSDYSTKSSRIIRFCFSINFFNVRTVSFSHFKFKKKFIAIKVHYFVADHAGFVTKCSSYKPFVNSRSSTVQAVLLVLNKFTKFKSVYQLFYLLIRNYQNRFFHKSFILNLAVWD
jgi:hypothetical protein